jgi:hypothetical protein
MACRDVGIPRQHTKAAISRAAKQHRTVQAREGTASSNRGAGPINQAGGDGTEPSCNSRWRVPHELGKIQQPGHTITSTGKATTKHRQAQRGNAGKGGLNSSQALSPRSGQHISRRLAIGEGNPKGNIHQRQATPGSRRGERCLKGSGRRHSTQGQDARLSWVEALAGGSGESVHGGEESGDVSWRPQQHLGIISVGASGDGARAAREEVGKAYAPGTQEGQQCLGNEEVQERGEGTALAHTSKEGCRPRDEAIHNSTRTGVSEQGPDQGNEIIPHTKSREGREEECTVDGVIRLVEITEDSQGPTARAAQQVGQQLQCHDVVTNATPRHKGSLLRVNDVRQARAKATSQQKGVEAVICVQQGNGAVVGRVRAIPRLVHNGNETLMEARGQDASGGNSR